MEQLFSEHLQNNRYTESSTIITENCWQHPYWKRYFAKSCFKKHLYIHMFYMSWSPFLHILEAMEIRSAILVQRLYYKCLVGNFWNFMFLSFWAVLPFHRKYYIASNLHPCTSSQILILKNIILLIRLNSSQASIHIWKAMYFVKKISAKYTWIHSKCTENKNWLNWVMNIVFKTIRCRSI